MKIEDFSHRKQFLVHWGEMDAFQHLNNTYYFRYFESARSYFFKDMMLERNSTGIGPILAGTSCKFIVPVEFPDKLTVCTRLKSTGNTSFVLEHAIFSEKKGLAAIGEAIIVMYDYKKGEKTAIPEKMLNLLKEQ